MSMFDTRGDRMAMGWPSGESIEASHEFRVAIETDHRVHLGERGHQFGLVTLSHASQHNELGISSLHFGEFQNRLDGLAPGLLNEGAGVDHDDIGLFGRGALRVPCIADYGPYFFRVDLVLGAAQRGEIDRGRGRVHRRESTTGATPRRQVDSLEGAVAAPEVCQRVLDVDQIDAVDGRRNDDRVAVLVTTPIRGRTTWSRCHRAPDRSRFVSRNGR